MKGMILAAGLGTRLRPLTNTVPKAAVPLLNVPLGFWTLFHLKNAGVDDLVVNTHYLPEKVVTLFESIRPKLRRLHFTLEKDKILGSGGGIGFARKYLEVTYRGFSGLVRSILQSPSKTEAARSFWVANGDEVFLPDESRLFKDTWHEHVRQKHLATLIVIENDDVGTKFGGVWCDNEMNVRGFGKTPPSSGLKGYHFTGFQVLNSRVFQYIPEGESNIFYDVLVAAIAKGDTVKARLAKGLWFESGNLEDLKAATEHLLPLRQSHPILKSLLQEFSLK